MATHGFLEQLGLNTGGLQVALQKVSLKTTGGLSQKFPLELIHVILHAAGEKCAIRRQCIIARRRHAADIRLELPTGAELRACQKT